MKSYTKKMLSLTSSLLIAAQQCFIAMPAGAVDTPSEAEDYAQSIGLELNSGAAKDSLSDLIDINDEGLAVAVDDNNNVTQINGVLLDETVDNSNDAKDIIAKASELLDRRKALVLERLCNLALGQRHGDIGILHLLKCVPCSNGRQLVEIGLGGDAPEPVV